VNDSLTVAKPVVVVLVSRGGGGHLSAASAIREAFAPTMDVQVVNYFEEACPGIDHVAVLTRGKFTGEDLYNHLQRRGRIRTLSFYTAHVGRWGLAAHTSRMVGQLAAFLSARHADAVISTIPFVNNAVAGAARALDIPAIVVSCDYDPRTFAGGGGRWAWERFRMTVPMASEQLIAAAVRRGARPEQIRVAGYPVRASFREPMSKAVAREQLGIAADRPVVFFATGASGADHAHGLVRAALKLPVHVVAGVGRNTALGDRLSALGEARTGQLRVVGFVDTMPAFLAACDVFVTKTGSGSISEALCSLRAPILEATAHLLPWERTNARLFSELGVAEVAASGAELVAAIERRIENPAHAEALEARVRALPQLGFTEELRCVLVELGTRGVVSTTTPEPPAAGQGSPAARRGPSGAGGGEAGW
jgi:UDP-N-acetylglucosamine:LPS N-acetylglucosamine transferase